MKKELEELTGKIRAVVKDYPAVAYRLGFLQNFTLSRNKDRSTAAPLKKEKEEEEGAVAIDNGREEMAAVVLDGGVREGGEREEGRGVAGGEREGEREWSRGGYMDHNEADGVGDDELDFILKEVRS